MPISLNSRDRMPLTLALLITNGILFLLQQMGGEINLLRYMALWPLGGPFAVYGLNFEVGFFPTQLITYGFLHGSLAHLFFNMLALYMFGLPLERLWGSQRFSLYYFTCLIGAGLIQLWVASSGSGPPYPTIGASGAVYGLLLAYGVTWPNNRIVLLIPPIPIKAKYFVLIFGAIELFLGLSGRMPGVAHFAHLGGMLFGAALLWHWGWRPFGRR